MNNDRLSLPHDLKFASPISFVHRAELVASSSHPVVSNGLKGKNKIQIDLCFHLFGKDIANPASPFPHFLHVRCEFWKMAWHGKVVVGLTLGNQTPIQISYRFSGFGFLISCLPHPLSRRGTKKFRVGKYLYVEAFRRSTSRIYHYFY